MSKQATTPSLKATKRAAKAPSPATVVKADAPAEQPPVVDQPVATPAAPAAAPAVVPVRGGLAIAAVKLTGKQYRVTAAHNVDWWNKVQAAVKAGKGQAAVTAIVKDGVPVTMVGYLVRRGYLTSV